MEFGEKIKALRIEQGLTLEAVGERVGVGKSTVRKWESGQIANMRRDKIALLAKALNVTPAYLMGWKEDETAPSTVAHNAPVQQDERTSEVIRLFGSLDQEHQETLLHVLRGLLADQKTSRGSRD